MIPLFALNYISFMIYMALLVSLSVAVKLATIEDRKREIDSKTVQVYFCLIKIILRSFFRKLVVLQYILKLLH